LDNKRLINGKIDNKEKVFMEFFLAGIYLPFPVLSFKQKVT